MTKTETHFLKKYTLFNNCRTHRYCLPVVIQKHHSCTILFLCRIISYITMTKRKTSKTCALWCDVAEKQTISHKVNWLRSHQNSSELWFARKDSKTRFALTSLLLYWSDTQKLHSAFNQRQIQNTESLCVTLRVLCEVMSELNEAFAFSKTFPSQPLLQWATKHRIHLPWSCQTRSRSNFTRSAFFTFTGRLWTDRGGTKGCGWKRPFGVGACRRGRWKSRSECFSLSS